MKDHEYRAVLKTLCKVLHRLLKEPNKRLEAAQTLAIMSQYLGDAGLDPRSEMSADYSETTLRSVCLRLFGDRVRMKEHPADNTGKADKFLDSLV